MSQLRLEPISDNQTLVHLWGRAGSGKTLIASALAAEASRTGEVEWINTDGKSGFLGVLKSNTVAAGGSPSRIRLTMVHGHCSAIEAIRRVATQVPQQTKMIVVDTVTRILDMSTVDDVLWGREMIEEVLPLLAALSAKGITVILISEVRSTEVGLLPVMYNSIVRWKPRNLRLARGPGRHSTILLPSSEGEEVLALMKVNEQGLVQLHYPSETNLLVDGDEACLERQSYA